MSPGRRRESSAKTQGSPKAWGLTGLFWRTVAFRHSGCRYPVSRERRGVVRDYADLTRLGCTTRARATPVMNLLLLAPDIQEEILFLPKTTIGHNPISERRLRRLTAIVRWNRQREVWQEMRDSLCKKQAGSATIAS